jgi:hypothetical protein
MANMQAEALGIALEALEYIDREDNDRDFLFPFQCTMLDKAITAIKQARSALVQGPVAHDYRIKYDRGCYKCLSQFCPGNCIDTTPPAAQRQWTGLTDEEIEKVWQRTQANDFHDCVQPFARAIEAKLKEKNT